MSYLLECRILGVNKGQHIFTVKIHDAMLKSLLACNRSCTCGSMCSELPRVVATESADT